MRIVAVAACILAATTTLANVWTKSLVPGLDYTMEVDGTTPRLVHVLRFKPGWGVTAKPEAGGGRIYSLSENNGRETLGAMIARTGALGGINADFFPFTGDPLGAMVRDGVVVSRPDPRRVALVWDKGGAKIARLGWSLTLSAPGGVSFPIDGLNEECGDNMIVLFTDAAAQTRAKTANCVAVPLHLEPGKWTPQSTRDAQTLAPIVNQPSIRVDLGGAILMATGANADRLRTVQAGTPIRISMRVSGVTASDDLQAAGGGPNLLTNGAVDITGSAEGLGGAFEQKRHPRSAVGITRSGELVFVVVDGRQDMSAGCTLPEQAAIMRRLGCVNAMNFDGGGSSAINLLGVTLNRPSDGRERPLANAVLFYGTRPAPPETSSALDGPGSVETGAAARFRVATGPRTFANDRQILWAAMGDGWIDGSGTFRPLRPGIAHVTALYRGTKTTARVEIRARVEPPVPARKIKD